MKAVRFAVVLVRWLRTGAPLATAVQMARMHICAPEPIRRRRARAWFWL